MMPSTDTPRIVIFGATGRVGQMLAGAFQERGHEVVAVGRRKDILDALPGEGIQLDLSDAESAEPVANDGDIVINAAHARFTQAIAGLCTSGIARLVVIGSTRYMTRFPDRKADDVRLAARFLQSSGLPWVMLHPTMIYGARGENNVQRMAAIIRRFHAVPLPNAGAALIQPVHVGDVVDAVVTAATKPGLERQTIHLGGPKAVSYRAFLEAIAKASECRVKVVPFPAVLLKALAALTRIIPGMPSVTGAEVQRLLEDKDVDIGEMQTLLGIKPRALDEGLKETFARPSKT